MTPADLEWLERCRQTNRIVAEATALLQNISTSMLCGSSVQAKARAFLSRTPAPAAESEPDRCCEGRAALVSRLMKAEDRVIAAQRVGIDALARIADQERAKEAAAREAGVALANSYEHTADLERELAAARALTESRQTILDDVNASRDQLVTDNLALRAAIDAAVVELDNVNRYDSADDAVQPALSLLRAAQKAAT